MGPLIALGLSFLPSLAKLMIGDRAGAVAASVTDVVREVTGTSDPVAAKQKLDADPAVVSALRIRLAEIALDGERLQAEAEAKRRQAELDTLREEIKNTQDARGTMVTLAQAGSSISWGPVAVSLVVTSAFFIFLVVLIRWPPGESNTQAYSLLNIAVGALVAGFTAVVNFWIGSSQGSRDKDRAVRDLTSQQAVLSSQALSRAQEVSGGAGAAVAQAVESVVRSVRGASTAVPLAAPRAGEFDRCVEVVLSKEGGFSDNPNDPGGATNFGITLKTLEAHRGSPVTADDVRSLTQPEAREIYRSNYWNAMRCDDLPPGIDLMVFDFGVNAGPATAVRFLQTLVGAEADGSIGPKTLAAVGAQPVKSLIDRYAAMRDQFYRDRPNFAVFGKGWLERVKFVQEASQRLAAG